MNYDRIKHHLERAHSILIESGEELDLHELGAFPAALARKDWRGATAILEECGASANCDAAFWREMLLVARELGLPRYVARFEARVQRETK